MKLIRTILLGILGVALLPTFIKAQPTITNFTPASGSVGTLVTITGTNLSSPTVLSIGGVQALPISNTGTSLVAMVMPGATTGTISISTVSGVTNTAGNFTVTPAQTPNGQQGGKLTGTDATGIARQGWSVAVSANGNTAIVGGYSDNSNVGAAWVYIRSGDTWTQQGGKLVGTGAIGNAQQGYSVSISTDGNTVLVGGHADNSNFGAAWVFIRSGTTWSQQGNKLVGTGATGTTPRQGWSVDISADGNTAIVGGYGDNSLVGAIWVYVRNGATWSQQGSKLAGTGAIGSPRQGWSVALSADGRTAIVGGYQDNSSTGAAWIFFRSGATWAQQGSKLVGTGTTGAALQGYSVSLNADGNTAIVGGYADNSLAGAAWVYTRSGSTWTQQGNKLVGTGATGAALQGSSVSLSADGNMVIIGGSADNNNAGAAWFFTRSGTTWTQQGNKLVGIGASGAAQLGYSVSLSADGSTAMAGGFADNANSGAGWVFVNRAPPTITGFSPANGPAGTLVTIIGTNLDNPTALSIGGVPSILISQTATRLVLMVMPGAVTGLVNVSTQAGITDAAATFTLTPSLPPNAQEGARITGPDVTTSAVDPFKVALSADGNTAIMGGSDGNGMPAAWVYIRSNGAWTLQGDKLTGTNAVGNFPHVYSVAINADGNTAIVGSHADNTDIGAVWVFTRNGSSWSQQGNKLVGTGAVGAANMGQSVSLSADGNTLITGGWHDNGNAGASWIFTRSNGVWTQQGNKLAGTGAVGVALQGAAVSLSADGNTAIVGGIADNSSTGAAWIFTRNGSTWSQQGNKLVGNGATYQAIQGSSVALSSDGNTAIVGGSGVGFAWVFTRSGTSWTQQGPRFYGTDETGDARQGGSVSISADGNTALIGGDYDNGDAGAWWLFTRSGNTWTQQGKKICGTEGIRQGGSVALSSDGNTAMVGGIAENTNARAAWGFINVQKAMPIITSFTPASGLVGSLITIAGNYLGNPSEVMIGGVQAIVISNTGTSLVAMVMPGAISGAVTLTTQGGIANGAGSFTLNTVLPPNNQQGEKLTGTNAAGASLLGNSVAISADGNTAIVGGYGDNSNMGAVWIFTRSGNSWTQQGDKLVGFTYSFEDPWQGVSVALSADGNTAIVGGYRDESNTGAAWIFARSNGVWTQQGEKLVGTGAIGDAYQGQSVAMSADGKTAILGGPVDNGGLGAAWVFTRTGSNWIQLGNKLTGTGNQGASNLGYSVSLSADGNTAVIGGPGDNGLVGAAWVFTRSGTTWAQQGNKLVGTGTVGNSRLAYSVSVSADGNTAILGAPSDNNGVGAAYVFTRNGSIWIQQGNRMIGTGVSGIASQGVSVALSADGNISIVGGYADNNYDGAAWVFIRNGSVWTQSGTKLVGIGSTNNAEQGVSVSLSAEGNTAMVGGYEDNNQVGAAWVYNFIPVLPPTITNFTPASGPVGTLVTITGTNLSNPSALIIGGVQAMPISNTGNNLVAMVMPGATTSAVSITTAGGTTNGAVNFTLSPAPPPNTQQGNKLAGTGATGAAQQGFSVAVSADGNTAIVGAFADNFFAGAAWVYTRSGTSWSQQGSKLVGTGAIGNAYQGYSVAISADGNTAIIGGSGDNGNGGAAWIFVRSGSVWTQQSNKLVGTGVQGAANQGHSVALSADGNTAIVGGPNDNGNYGAAWVYTRSGSSWSQRGNKLSGGITNQGFAVAISADGNTAISGAPFDNSSTGAARVFAYINGIWQAQGSKLVGTGATGAAQQGYSVALSADGNTALVGGRSDNSGAGATWVYTRSGTTWTQQGDKLVGTGAVGIAQQGVAVALSADGNMAMVGGDQDNSSAGAIWMFTRSGSTWTQQGNKLVGTGQVGNAEQGRSLALSADGKTALVGGPKDNGNAGTTWVFTNALQLLYTFTGSGNWNVAANWANNQIPPAVLPANAQIVINPAGTAECILNVPLTVPASATITVAPGKKFRIPGNLNISQ